MARGAYPRLLETLMPDFIEKLPADIINGQSLHYVLKENGRYVLYSVGWNEMDDGGSVVRTRTGLVDPERGDWVWQTEAGGS